MNSARIFFILFTLQLFTACEKVIDVDLREASPQLVIVGNVTNEPGPYYVRLTYSVGFEDPNDFPPAVNAVVVLSDNNGTEEILQEISPGLYQADEIKGMPGMSYELSVVLEGKEYTATSTMPPLISLESISIEEGGFIGENERDVVVGFPDEPGIKNYYRFVAWRNELPFNRPYVFDDKGYDGDYLRYSFEPDEDNEDLKIVSQDEVTVEMQGVDSEVYLYFLTLSQYTGEGPPTAPANPISNIKGGALGYFSAHTISRKSIIVE